MTNETRSLTTRMKQLVLPCVTAMAFTLCLAPSARAQATHSTVDLMVTTPDGNMYSCELTLVTTPSGRANGHCTAESMMEMSAVTEATQFDDQMAWQMMEMDMGGMIMTMEMPFGMVDVEELPGGTANITYHS